MNIGIIGSGGREHSICFKLRKSKKINNLYCIPGNAGTAEISENLNVNYNDFNELYKIVIKKNIDLLIIGPEEPLVNGIVDFFEKKKIKVFGPSKKASRLEGSKAFMKKLCRDFDIPTARSKEIKSSNNIQNILKNFKLPIVDKSDGLAAGKGVTICKSKEKAIRDIKEILRGKFKSSKKVIVEEFLSGKEASYFVITDGKNYFPIGTAQDHKRIGEKDTGPNTGGMGAYSPSKLITRDVENKIKKKIIEPTLRGLSKKGCPYKGILYAGLMIENSNPKLIEYNIRFGDPECQIIMMRLKNDLLDLIEASIYKKLKRKKITWTNEKAITIVAASKGYPGNYKKFKEIKNIKKIKLNKKKQLFHASTIKKNNKYFSSGGRVLNSTVLNKNLKVARSQALKILDNLDWENKYYRRDIGYQVIDK